MIGYTYRARIDRWIDADTVDVLVDCGFRVSALIRARLARIDAPERGTPGHLPAMAEIDRLAPAGAEVVVITSKGDRYGRWIAEVIAAGTNVADALLAAGLAVPYPKTQTTGA